SSKTGVNAGAPYPFADAAGTAGIHFTLGHKDGLLNILEAAGSGAGFLDYDRDGKLDLVLVAENRCALYRNLGGGRIEDVTAASRVPQRGHWTGSASADFDNDGYPDLFLNGYGSAALLHNDGKGGFVDV